jgi:hypothetical protein
MLLWFGCYWGDAANAGWEESDLPFNFGKFYGVHSITVVLPPTKKEEA